MKQLALLLCLSICQFGLPSTGDSILFAVATKTNQNKPTLTLSQVQRLVKIKAPDETVAGEIRKRGVGFTVDDKTLATLRKLGAGPKTVKALLALKLALASKPSVSPVNPNATSTSTVPKPLKTASDTTADPKAVPIALPLRDFEFDVVTLDSSGSETSRRKVQAQYCTENTSGISLELVQIPGGTFLMGSSEASESQAKAAGAYKRDEYFTETPAHRVTVESFYMGKYEVTQAQWRIVAGMPKVTRDLNPNPSRFMGDTLPVERVSWQDVMEFCARLSRATGRSYRLPTEAEWEYACRGGTTTPFAFGQTITPQLVNYDGNHPYAQAPTGEYRVRTKPVGFIGAANGFGLFDMHGNVLEWCMDYWHNNYDGAPSDGASWQTEGDTRDRVLRGGAWPFHANDCRSARRSRLSPDVHTEYVGFRVVASLRTP